MKFLAIIATLFVTVAHAELNFIEQNIVCTDPAQTVEVTFEVEDQQMKAIHVEPLVLATLPLGEFSNNLTAQRIVVADLPNNDQRKQFAGGKFLFESSAATDFISIPLRGGAIQKSRTLVQLLWGIADLPDTPDQVRGLPDTGEEQMLGFLAFEPQYVLEIDGQDYLTPNNESLIQNFFVSCEAR